MALKYPTLFLASSALILGAATAASADVVISSSPTQDMTCSNGVCSPTATNAVLNTGDLETLLASGNVEVTTMGSGVQAGNLEVDAPLAWSAANILTLDAYQSVLVKATISVGGPGGMAVTTNDGGSGGTFSFGRMGKVTFQSLSSPLTIDGTGYRLVNSLPALAAAVDAKPKRAYALANSYDASQDGTYNRPPIGDLKGMIEGLGNTISHLSIHKKKGLSGVALIHKVDSTGSVANLRLERIRYRYSSGHAASTGGIAVYNEGFLFGDAVTGSIVLELRKRLTAGIIGGLAAFNAAPGDIVSSWTDVQLMSNFASGGGLAGWNDGIITLSHAAGPVSATLAGGLVGQNEGTLSQDYATGVVSGEAGGLVSVNESDGVYTGTIDNSYSTGAVSGNRGSGGFVQDQSGGEISDSYSTGAAFGGDGGFACTGGSDFSDDYWDTSTSGTQYSFCYQGHSNGITGLTSKQLRSGLPAGFDPAIWAQDRKINNGFPYLINNPPVK